MLEIGKVYKFKDGIDREAFSFGYKCGCFIGYTGSGWPRFILNVEKGTECFINATDDSFKERKFNQKTPEQPKPEEIKLRGLITFLQEKIRECQEIVDGLK